MRAEALMKFYRDEEIKGIFDVSGGDLANGVLPWLDYEVIAKSGKAFWGYSDLTTVVNAITAKTGKPSVLYQIRNLIYQDGEEQKCRFRDCLLEQNQENGSSQIQCMPESMETEERGHIQEISWKDSLFDVPYKFLQGNEEFNRYFHEKFHLNHQLLHAYRLTFPELTGKILLLEAFGGGDAQLLTYFSQLEQLGAFRKVSGILLGTFTKLEREKGPERVWQLLKDFVPAELPVAKTDFIGHGTDSRAAVIGRNYELYQ